MTHAAVVFPGMSYGHDSPILRLAAAALAQVGASVRQATYPVLSEWDRSGRFWTPEREARFADDVHAVIDDVTADSPTRVTLVGKSLGTHALASLVDHPRLPANTDAVWVTPILGEDDVFHAARRSTWRSLYIAGLADTAHVPSRQSEVGGEVLELPGADHSLDVDGDVLATIDGLRTFVERLLAFLDA